MPMQYHQLILTGPCSRRTWEKICRKVLKNEMRAGTVCDPWVYIEKFVNDAIIYTPRQRLNLQRKMRAHFQLHTAGTRRVQNGIDELQPLRSILRKHLIPYSYSTGFGDSVRPQNPTYCEICCNTSTTAEYRVHVCWAYPTPAVQEQTVTEMEKQLDNVAPFQVLDNDQ